jgi:hypothetical protein
VLLTIIKPNGNVRELDERQDDEVEFIVSGADFVKL